MISQSPEQREVTDDGTHRRDIETEQTATNNGDGGDHVDVSDGIHGCCTPPSRRRMLCEEETERRKQSCFARIGPHVIDATWEARIHGIPYTRF
jgi:hypothetical protein